MADRGGLFGKLGIQYEDRWTVRCVLSVLQDEAEAIRLEPPGPEGDGIEFWLRFPDRVEYHQVKRQRSGEGRWTISALRSSGVLDAFLEKLRDPEAHCVFVSGHSAYTLEALAMRASLALSRSEFDDELASNQTLKSHYDELSKAWGMPDADLAFSALQRISVRTISETELSSRNELETKVVLAGDLPKAVAVVTEVVHDRAGAYLTAAEVWKLLARKGYTPNPWRSSRTLLEQVATANQRFITSRERMLIGQGLIPRNEVDELRSLIDEHQVTVLDGAAGMGKSDVLLQFVRDLDASGIPFLAFRLDRTAPTVLPDALGEDLGLPGSPATVLAALAQQARGVLVIDQLDIVSTTSGRNPEFLECVLDIVRHAVSAPNLRVVLSCRTFDIENDTRLRTLIPTTDPRPVVTVGPLQHEQITDAVLRMGLDEERLTATQRAILGVPLHLALLSEILEPDGEQTRALDFTTTSELYEKFWDAKQRELQGRLGRVPAWTAVLDRLVNDMSEKQLLRAQREIVDEWQLDVEAMVSSRVLTTDGAHLAFFHETFFDYVFARRFSARGRTVAGLLSSDQFLFRRAQVRQILAYSRGRARSYRHDLAFLLTDETVRFHIRDLVVSWLAQVDPSDDEWELLKPHLDDAASPLHGRAWQTLASPAWLRAADACGYLTHCLENATHVDVVVHAIGLGGAGFSDRTVELLRPYIDDPEWIQRIVWIVQRADLAKSPALFDLFLELLDSGGLDRLGLTRQDFWYIAHDLPKSAPTLANQLLGHYLENRLQAAQQAGVTHPFRDADIVPRDLHLLEYVTDAAQQAPGAFVEHVWPPMHTIIEAALKPSREDRLQMDDVWLRRHFGEVYADLDDQLLLGAEHAFRGLAKDSPSEFVALAETLRDTNSETVVFLLFEAYAANPSAFADEALDSLSTDPRRLRVGYSDSDEWQTRRLLEAVTPHASDEAIIRLEPVLLSFFTSWEKSAAGHRQFGLSQFALLGGVDPVRRTPAMRKRFAEWQRKFLLDDAPPPIGIFGGTVQSPIAGEAAAKMSDTQWLKAMRRYGDDDFRSRRDFLTGGAHQLSSVLEARAKAEPERFAALASGMPDDTNVAYFEAILRGVVDSDGGPSYDQTIALLLRCHALPGRPTGRWIARPLRHHLDQPLPDAIIDMLEWYATQDPDPGADPGGDADRPVHEGLAQRGLNSVRGGLAYELARFVWHRPDLIKPLLPSITSLVADPMMAVRSMAADIIVALLRDEPNRALDLFDTLMTDATDDLLAIRSINDVMRYRIGPDFARLQPHLERMVNSPVQATQTSGAALASIAALSNDEARELADACAAGTVTQRIGAAKVCAANLTSAGFRTRCEQQLVAFFDDPSKEVRDAAAGVVRRFEGDEIREYALLIAAFNRSTAGEENVDDLLFAFSEMTSVAADIALDACAEILERIASGDPEARLQGLHADQVSQILVRVYADGDAAVMNRALDLIDQSLELNLYGVSRALADHDRPWLAASP